MSDVCPFIVGEAVTHCERGGEPIDLLTVVGIKKRPQLMELSDGRQWQWDGRRPYTPVRSRDRWWMGGTIRARYETDAETIEVAKMARALSQLQPEEWKKLSARTLRIVCAALRKANCHG